MKKVSLLILIFTLITLVLVLSSCGAEAEATNTAANGAQAAAGEPVPPLLPTITAELKAGNVDAAFDIIMDSFTTSAGVVGAVFAVIFFLIFLALYYLGLWIFII